LHDSYVGGLLHFGGGVEETVYWNAGVGVNCYLSVMLIVGVNDHTQEDIIPNSDVAICPSPTVFLKSFFKASLVCLSLVL